MKSFSSLPEDLVVCNCARCGDLLSSVRQTLHLKRVKGGHLKHDGRPVPPYVHAKHEDRPYCFVCYSIVMGGGV
jgi:hypothetical protein